MRKDLVPLTEEERARWRALAQAVYDGRAAEWVSSLLVQSAPYMTLRLFLSLDDARDAAEAEAKGLNAIAKERDALAHDNELHMTLASKAVRERDSAMQAQRAAETELAQQMARAAMRESDVKVERDALAATIARMEQSSLMDTQQIGALSALLGEARGYVDDPRLYESETSRRRRGESSQEYEDRISALMERNECRSRLVREIDAALDGAKGAT